MTELKIPAGELSAVLSKAILDSLSADTKERLIEGALQYLITQPPKASSYHSYQPPSPLQQAFEQALNKIALGVAEEVLETHGAKAKLTAQFAELLSSVPDFDDDYELQRSMMAAVLKRAREIRGEC